MTTRPVVSLALLLALGSPAAALDQVPSRVEAMGAIEGNYTLGSPEKPEAACTVTLTLEWIDPKLQTLAKVSAPEDCGAVSPLFASSEELSWMVRNEAGTGFEIQSRPRGSDAAPTVIDFTLTEDGGSYDGKSPLGDGKWLTFAIRRATH